MNRRLGVLISGRGSNLQAIINAIADGRLDAEIAVVISNRADAGGLERAREAGLECLVIGHADYGSREEFDRGVVSELKKREVGLVCLAGFMRLLSAEFVAAFPDRILNIHPSLLPGVSRSERPGAGMELWGEDQWSDGTHCDASARQRTIMIQAAVPVEEDDTPERLAARILEQEHRIYPEAIRLMLDGEWHVDGRRFVRGSRS